MTFFDPASGLLHAALTSGFPHPSARRVDEHA
jgi:hypothetical protein